MSLNPDKKPGLRIIVESDEVCIVRSLGAYARLAPPGGWSADEIARADEVARMLLGVEAGGMTVTRDGAERVYRRGLPPGVEVV
jgi:hypothetical protein